MRIKPCPKCSRMPKITEAISLKKGTRRYFIACPNYCAVLVPKTNPNRWEFQWQNLSFLVIEGNLDYNKIYKAWNDAIKE